MSTSSSLRQQFGAFCTNVPLGVRTLLEAPGLTTTFTAPKTALCVCPPLGKGFSSTGSTVGSVLKKRRSRRLVCCVCPPLDKGFPSTTPIRQGAQAHRGYLCQRSCSTMGDAEIDHLRVPAELLDKLSPYFSTV